MGTRDGTLIDLYIDKPFELDQAVKQRLYRKDYFEKESETYSWIKFNIIMHILNSIYHYLWKSTCVLDVGCGWGFWTKQFLDKGAAVVCIDRDIRYLRQNWTLNPKAVFVCADATQVDLQHFTPPFDLIFCKDAIEHIQDDQTFLLNMGHHLRFTGRILIVTQNSWSLNWLLQAPWNWLKGNIPWHSWYGWDEGHVRFYNPSRLNARLKAAGFRPIKWFSSYFFPYRPLKERFGLDLTKMLTFIERLGWYDKFPFKYLGWNIGVLAEKI